MEHRDLPTIFHVTHWKAGSQWVRSVLKHAAPDRFVQPGASGLIGGAIIPGGVYSPVYANNVAFRAAVAEAPREKTFVVIRDPRDTLISWYFSLMYSHDPDEPTVDESRAELRQLSKDDGLALMIGKHLREVIDIQRQWIEAGGTIFRYEDLRANQQDEFEKIFTFCELDISRWRRRSIVRRHSFIRRTWWRFGRESTKSHLRKGVVGDWKNHFTDELKGRFKALHNETLMMAGYENGDRW